MQDRLTEIAARWDGATPWSGGSPLHAPADIAWLLRVATAARGLCDAETAADVARETYGGAETARTIDEAVRCLSALRAALESR